MSTLPLFGQPDNMPALRESALDCTRCRLHEGRQQVVWGAGDVDSPLMMVGQGPSVTDDRTGNLYSGPAGDELDEVLQAAGLSRDTIYLTNIHKCLARKKDDRFNIRPPTKTELRACRPWLDAEFEIVKPRYLVCVGSPAAKWLLGDAFDLSAQRGEWVDGPFATQAMATYQPTYITRLRQHDSEKAAEAYQHLIGDLRRAANAAALV